MPQYKALIAYDGSAFYGFSAQESYPTVLESLQNALQRVGIKSQIHFASRTDRGVHATAQVISFESKRHLQCDLLRDLLNLKLSPHIFVKSLKMTSNDFHPRFSARWRAYRFVLSSQILMPFYSRFVSYAPLGDRDLFMRALHCFVGRHNFKMFKKQGSPTRDDVREIFCVRLYEFRGLNVVYMRGSGFLRAQMRLMVGAALSVSHQKLSLESLQSQIAGEIRAYHYPIAPNGLYLCGVGYE